jgi:hypothetical protein
MKLTIIKDDGAVYKDGLNYLNLDLNQMPSDVHALQWDNNVGYIEFVNCYKSNEEITELPLWANDALTKWQISYDKEQKKIADEKEIESAKTKV